MNSDDKHGDNDNELFNEPLTKLMEHGGYYDMDNLPLAVTQNKSVCYRTIHLNVHSLPRKYDQLVNLLSHVEELDMKLDFTMLCEIFLNPVNYNNYDIPGYQFIESHRKNKRGGGVGIYINKTFQFSVRNDIAVH
jgi:uncharacterized protein (UPF0128 family)